MGKDQYGDYVGQYKYYEREIQKGLESGPPIPVTPEFWEELNAEIEQAYHEKRKGHSA